MWENSKFGHTSFIKVVINGTIAKTSHKVSHEGLLEAETFNLPKNQFFCPNGQFILKAINVTVHLVYIFGSINRNLFWYIYLAVLTETFS